MPAAQPQKVLSAVPYTVSHDGVNGILLDTASASGLTRGLHRLLSLPESRRRQLARAGQETVADHYSVTLMAQALAGIYGDAARA